MSMLKRENLVYDDGRTLQSFKDETDVNKLLVRAQRAGTLSHLEKYEGVYGEMGDYDGLLDAFEKKQRGDAAFAELPAEIRREFNQSPAEFYKFVTAPENQGKLGELLPALAKPGTQRIDVSGKTPPSGVGSAVGAKTTTTEVPTGSSEKTSQAGSQAALSTPAEPS